MLEPNDTDNPVNSPENPKNQQDDSALQAGCLVSTLSKLDEKASSFSATHFDPRRYDLGLY